MYVYDIIFFKLRQSLFQGFTVNVCLGVNARTLTLCYIL